MEAKRQYVMTYLDFDIYYSKEGRSQTTVFHEVRDTRNPVDWQLLPSRMTLDRVLNYLKARRERTNVGLREDTNNGGLYVY